MGTLGFASPACGVSGVLGVALLRGRVVRVSHPEPLWFLGSVMPGVVQPRMRTSHVRLPGLFNTPVSYYYFKLKLSYMIKLGLLS